MFLPLDKYETMAGFSLVRRLRQESIPAFVAPKLSVDEDALFRPVSHQIAELYASWRKQGIQGAQFLPDDLEGKTWTLRLADPSQSFRAVVKNVPEEDIWDVAFAWRDEDPARRYVFRIAPPCDVLEDED